MTANSVRSQACFLPPSFETQECSHSMLPMCCRSQYLNSDRRDYSLKRRMQELSTAAIAAEQHQLLRLHNAKLSCHSVKFRTVQYNYQYPTDPYGACVRSVEKPLTSASDTHCTALATIMTCATRKESRGISNTTCLLHNVHTAGD